MLSDHVYNLMAQMVQEHKSLWRIRNMYLEDSANCVDCQKFWQDLADDKEEHIADLKELIAQHLD